MKHIQFPVTMNMCFYHYFINWGPVDIFSVEYEILSDGKVSLFLVNLHVEFSTTDSEKSRDVSV